MNHHHRVLILLAAILPSVLFASVDPQQEIEPIVKKRRANVITVDTRDQESCLAVQGSLEKLFPKNDYQELCKEDEENPFNSVIAVDPTSVTHKVYLDELTKDVPERYKKLGKESRNIAGLGLMTIGLIYMLPEDVSHWDKSKMGNLGKNWKDNVKEGPVVDKDDWWINYIGHPLSGAAYHLVARHSGLGPWESFGYSVFMSTFFWEYGLEAFAEVPSIQDLILTPVIGSLLGEMFYNAEEYIDDNGGTLLGSKKLGSIAKVVMNPSEPLRNWINDTVFEREFIKSSRTYIYTRYPRDFPESGFHHDSDRYNMGGQIGIGIEFKF